VREHAIEHLALAKDRAHLLAGEGLGTGGKREQQQSCDGAVDSTHRDILESSLMKLRNLPRIWAHRGAARRSL
jgi:hypothetical protein